MQKVNVWTSRNLVTMFSTTPPSPFLLQHSAQQRSSQTNKSQSSAGNQVSICHLLLCPTLTAKAWSEGKKPPTPTQELDGYCRYKERERGSWNESSTNHTLISANLLHMFLHHVHCFVFLMRSYRPCMLLFCAPVQWFLSLQKTRKKKKKTRFGFCYLMPPSSLLRCFLLFEPLPVSSRCHFAFHPHPLVRISAALLCVSVGEYGSLWVLLCNCHVCLQ